MRFDAPSTGSGSRDILRRRRIAVVIYWIPAAVIVASGFLTIPNGWRGALWAAALTTMGCGCIVNALRCGRVHCYVTGPFLVLAAVAAALVGAGVVSLGSFGWNVLGVAIFAGALVLYYVPERIFGTYRSHR